MQTFITYDNCNLIAQSLDSKRLGKQRVEAITIAKINLGLLPFSGWCRHPAVKMWKGHEYFLVTEYIKSILYEWSSRGYTNDKCAYAFIMLAGAITDRQESPPVWWQDTNRLNQVIASHRSALLYKNFDYYKRFNWNSKPEMNYYWPI